MLRLCRQGRRLPLVVLCALSLCLAGCSSAPATKKPGRVASPGQGGGFYGGDRPPSELPDGLDQVADAVPVPLPRSKTGNKPYVALGKRYRPMQSAKGYQATGVASWYGKKFHGRRTSSGEPYDMFAMTAAHPVLPLPSFVRVTNLANNRSVVVKVNDRGPFLHGRIIDLSYAAAHRLDITRTGTGKVRVVALEPGRKPAPTVATTVPEVFTGVAGSAATSSTPVSVDPTPSGRLWHLQVGVFSDLLNALTLRQQLRQQGLVLSPPTDRSLAAGNPPYRVIAGPFETRQRAEQVRRNLSRQLGSPVALVDD